MRHRLLDIDDRLNELAYYQQHYPHRWIEFQSMYEMSWIYHENILDGVALTPEEIEEALASDITRDISLISIYRRIRNYKLCIDLIKDKAARKRLVYDIDLIKEIHATLVANIEDAPGEYRHNSPVHRAYFQSICTPGRIQHKLTQMLDLLNREPARPWLHPMEHAAKVHHKFMFAYPFSAWSGVVGRLLINLLLLRQGYVPLVIHCHDRQKYYQAVALTPEALTRLYAETAENNLDNAFHYFVELQCQPAASTG